MILLVGQMSLCFKSLICQKATKENNKYRKSNWESCTVTLHDESVAEYIEKITKRSPYVVSKGAVNFAFLGKYADILEDPARDTVFTTEYSGRTAMEVVYVLCGVEKAVPEVFASRYDLSYLLNGMVALSDD